MPAQEESEPSKEGPGEKKRGLEITPEMFIENPDAKRLREQELAYRTRKECVVELRMATNAVNEAARVLQRYFQVSPKLLGFGEACPGVLRVSCCGVALWALRNLATSMSMIWVCFKVM